MTELEQKVDRLETVLADFIVASNQDRAESARFRAEMERDRREMNKKWGELANKMGTLAEDIVAPNIPRVVRENFGASDLQHFSVRNLRRKATDHGQRYEFDVIAVSDQVVIWTDVKSNPRPEYMRDFINALPAFFEFFPEYRGRRLVPIFASLYLPPDIVASLTRHKVYGLAMGDDVMELVNADALQGNG